MLSLLEAFLCSLSSASCSPFRSRQRPRRRPRNRAKRSPVVAGLWFGTVAPTRRAIAEDAGQGFAGLSPPSCLRQPSRIRRQRRRCSAPARRASRRTRRSTSYDAMSYQRISAGMGFTSIGRDRLLFRHESAARVRWQQGVGVWMDAKGSRTAVPVVAQTTRRRRKCAARWRSRHERLDSVLPGIRAALGRQRHRARRRSTSTRSCIRSPTAPKRTTRTRPATRSASRCPNKTVIQLRELKVRPRQPKWNLAVGSLWFDTKSGQLVRAAYRLSVPMDIWAVATEDDPKSMDDVPVWVKPMITPMKAEVVGDRRRIRPARGTLLAAASPHAPRAARR